MAEKYNTCTTRIISQIDSHVHSIVCVKWSTVDNLNAASVNNDSISIWREETIGSLPQMLLAPI